VVKAGIVAVLGATQLRRSILVATGGILAAGIGAIVLT
jgi:hypothetical protein